MSWLDAAIATVSPGWAAKRAVAQAQLERARLITNKVRGFNAVSKGRRASDWTKVGEDGKATEEAADLAILRARARDMSRNNPLWKQAVRTIVTQVVGHGIRATVLGPNAKTNKRVQRAWDDWAKSKNADAAGQLDWYGMQAQVCRAAVNQGECLAVRRLSQTGRLMLQILGAEYLCSAKDGELPGGGEIVGGVEVDQYGRPIAYHLFRRHPSRGGSETVRIEAKDVAHVFLPEEPGQQRGVPWIAPVFTRLMDWDDYEDAELMRQKVSACFGVIMTGVSAEGTEEDASGEDYEPRDKIEPGMIEYMPNGTEVKTIAPASNGSFRDTACITHHAIATGLGISYEALTSDFEKVNFSSARMANMQMGANVRDWQDNMMLERFCERVFEWFVEALTLGPVAAEEGTAELLTVHAGWTLPSKVLLDPERETKADILRVRAGFASWSDVVREQGRDPEQVAQALKDDAERFDKLGLVLDCDPRRVSAQGQGSVNQKQEGESNGSAKAA